jgi:hypothetical protein
MRKRIWFILILNGSPLETISDNGDEHPPCIMQLILNGACNTPSGFPGFRSLPGNRLSGRRFLWDAPDRRLGSKPHYAPLSICVRAPRVNTEVALFASSHRGSSSCGLMAVILTIAATLRTTLANKYRLQSVNALIPARLVGNRCVRSGLRKCWDLKEDRWKKWRVPSSGYNAVWSAGFLPSLFFDPEDGGDMFLRNECLPLVFTLVSCSADYTALYTRWWHSS